jgi:hypothetical protein
MNADATYPTPRIDRDAIYTDGDLRLLLGLTSAALARARRLGHLRHSRQGHRVLHRGHWVIDWLERDADRVLRERAGESETHLDA